MGLARKELSELYNWVARVAVPAVVTGTWRNLATLPAQLDIDKGYESLRQALDSAGEVTASQIGEKRIDVFLEIERLPTLAATLPNGLPFAGAVATLVAKMSDDEVLAVFRGITAAGEANPVELALEVAKLVQRAIRED